MSQPTDTIPDVHDTRIGRQSRRTILRALAATGSAAALGGVTSAQDEEDAGEEEVDEADFDDVPVAGEFPEGETVGLQLVAENLPAPTDLDYVEVDGEIHHFIITQTGQVFATNFDDVPDDIDDEDELTEEEEIEDDEDVVEPEEGSLIQEEDEPEEPVDVDDDPDDPEPDEEIAEDADEEVEPEPDEEVEDDVDPAEPQEFVFNGVVPAWFGMEPEEIDGEENPTLELTAGETYQFTWENGDGDPHNVVILDANDDILERTEIMQEAGESQTLEFEATEEMDRYLCEVHPGTMVGSIQVEPPEEEEEEVEDADSLTPADMDLFLDIEDQLVSLGIGELGGYDERGLLGLAFHPEFEENQLFYVHYSAPERHGLGYNHTAVVAEFQAEEDLTGVDPDSERTVMEIPQPQDNHNGGRLAFGPEGYLHVSLGDGGNVHDIGVGHVEDWYDENEGGNGQDTEENLHGGIHRIDVDAEDDQEYGEYGIPEDNPLVDSDEDIDSYWAWGFRNPWGMSIDDDGQVFVSDAGQHAIESVYAVEEGGNYSWNVKEGSFCFSPDSPLEAPAECPDEVEGDVSEARDGEPLLDPIAEYQHTRISEAFIDSSVVVGGHRYAGEAIPELEDNFVFGNWSSQGVADADGEVLVAVDPNGDDEMDDEDDEEELEDDADLDEEDEETEEAEEDSWIQDDDEEEVDEDDDEEEEEEEEELDDEDEDDLVEVDDRWELEELQFEGAEGESLNRYVYGVERDENGELYVLANTDFRPDPETGEIYRIVPAEEGEEIPEPEDPFVVDEEMEDEDPEAEAPDDVAEEDEEFPEGEDDEMPEEEAVDEPGADEAQPDDGAEPEPQEAD
ncbi:PQQ-dependent sugar dehydrogenase [Natronorubrum tibetense]|uniref:Blue (Type 1) copper domain-containing protein n=1 Tax=Natronorubrum tibetense GA33 TaxID=1114856 RepID=L9VWZ5_9EURY|nr:PQQ-dependent sugar dehydrogenase [Natronorubrum tibetense]ELY41506.1 blue (type 1) copper domain-containing protein [Natronorubrum tibetense GA33]